MRCRLLLLLLFSFTLFYRCKEAPEPVKPGLDGLWIIKLVKAGNREVTPNARWTRLNADLTQQSGNGWMQHSYGSWKLNESDSTLTIKNTNGLNDHNEPFTVHLSDDQMHWSRNEDGQLIEVTLERTDQLPQTYGDDLLGLWKLTEASGDGKYFTSSASEPFRDYIFFKWDRRFEIRTGEGSTHGVYNVHGHRPQLELIPYGEEVNRDYWKIEYGADEIELTLLDSDNVVTRRFERAHDFPQ